MQRVSSAPFSPLRTTVYLLPEQLPGPVVEEDQGLRRDFQIAGVKVWMDGSPFTGGAAWREPYENSELVIERMGLPVDHLAPVKYDVDVFKAQFLSYHRAGRQVAMHVQGERAVDAALEAVAWAQQQHPATKA